MKVDLDHPEMTIEPAEALEERCRWFLEPPKPSRYGALYLDQIDDPGNELRWLIDGWLTQGEKSVIAGASRAGKSFFALEIAMCIAFGLPLFGHAVRKGAVVYQTGEGALGLKKRLRAQRAARGFAFSRETPFVLLQNSIDIYSDKQGVFALIEEIKETTAVFDVRLELVVIDTLATASVGADEISGKDMGIVMENVKLINQSTGAHVMLVHHLSAQGRVRGHT